MKKTTQRILLFLLINLLPLSALTQINYYDGYYIDNNGDSIPGLIKNNGDQRNMKYCLFKKVKGVKSIKYYPNEIRAYYIEGKRYYVTGEEQFMEVLVEGRLSLYKFSNDATQRYSLRKPDGSITKLVNEKTMFIDEMNDKRYYVIGDSSNIDLDKHPGLELQQGKFYYGNYDSYYNVYKDTLYYAFAESEEMQDQIDKIKYSGKSLTAAISEFNIQTCNAESCNQYKKDFSQDPHRYGFYTGLGISKIFYRDSEIESSYEMSAPYIGAFVNFPFSKWDENLSLQFEFQGRKMSYTKPFQNLPSYINDIQIESFVLGFPMFLNYRIHLSSFSPLFGAGVEFGFNVWSQTNNNVQVTPIGSDVTEYRDVESKLQTWQEIGIFFDIGGEIKLNNRYSLITKLRFQSFGNSRESEEYRYPNLIFEDLGGASYRTNSAVLILGLAF